MLSGVANQLIDRGTDARRLLARKDLFHPAAVLLQQLQRQEQLTPRGIERQRGDHLRHALGQPGMARQMVDHGRRLRDDPRAEREQRRGGLGDIALQRRHRRHRIVVEIELMLLDQPRQRLDRQAVFVDRLQQFGGNRIALDAAMAGALPACRSTIAAAFRPATAG